jgi:cell wall-associated NlpC family hydrolase
MADKRITPARPDLAAAHLKGKVEAARYVEGEKFSVTRGHIPVREKPESYASLATELLCGEIFTVYEQKDGWAWGQNKLDGYVGYVHALCLCAPVDASHRVVAVSTPVLIRPDVKAASTGILPMNATVRRENIFGEFFQTNAGFIYHRHLVPVNEFAGDFVAVAERFLGTPYVWGGKTAAGIDCSGLIQTALQAAGTAAPRDTDMMEKALGLPVAHDDITRGDLIFWKGHMGVMLDKTRLLHANAFHMEVFAEDLNQAIARIEKTDGPVTSIKRL